MKSKFLALVTMFLMSMSVYAQNITVRGNVMSEDDGGPIIGASILVQGTSNGTVTDLDGNFILENVKAGSNLIVSYVGMKSKTVKAAARLNISLSSETMALEEVVVTALGIQRQAKALGYSTAKVDADQLNSAKGSDASAALSGKVSGLEISLGSAALDQQTTVQLRGARSFKGNNGALLILDGVQTPMSFLQTINPNDIDNISVLKGASAAALYGSEAANGVLIVTTKNGVKGKPQFTYAFTATANTVSYLPKTQTRFGSGHRQSGMGSWTYDQENSYMSPENQQYGPEFDGFDSYSGWYLDALDGKMRQIPYGYAGDDYLSGYYQTGTDFQHDISYSSSDDRGSMYLSYQRLDRKSVTRHDESTRQTVRFNGSRNFKSLTVGGKVTYSHSTFDMSTASSDGIYYLMQIPANYRVGDFVGWDKGDLGNGASPNEYFSDYSENPFFTLDTNRRETRQDRLVGSVDISFQPLKWLKFTGRAGVNLNVNQTNRMTYAFHYSETAQTYKYNAGSDQLSTFATASQLTSNFNMDFMAQANHKFNEDWEIKGLVGYSMQDNYNEYKNVNANQLAIDNLFNLSNKLGDLTAQNRWTRSRKTGLFGSVDLNYKNFAFIQVTGRNDWTSLLDPANRSFFYPSVNTSFVFTDAFKSLKSDVMNHWKMRASWAKVGTVNLEPYRLQTLAQVNSAFPYGTQTAYRLDTSLFSKDLKPEFTNEFEVGTEFGFFNNRITFEAAAYIQRTTNQTVPVSIATSTGFSSRYINAGTMEGKGLEFDLRINPIVKVGNFSFNLGMNATFVKTTVIELADDSPELNIESNIGGNSSYGIYAIKGKAFPQIKAQDWARDPQGRVIVDKNTGLPQAGNFIECGTTAPTVRLGITPSFRYKNWRLNATFDYRGGHVFYSGLEMSNCFTGSSYLSSIAGRQRTVFPNSVYVDDNGNYVENTNITINAGDDGWWNGQFRLSYANQVYSAATWRLRELSLNYEFPKKLINKIGFIQNISASLVGRNLFMWRPKTNIFSDPEFSTNGGNSNIAATQYNSNARGTQGGGQSAGYRSFGFNVVVTF
jgi:TonB-linked SusC/RagA family outer membrane protein